MYIYRCHTVKTKMYLDSIAQACSPSVGGVPETCGLAVAVTDCSLKRTLQQEVVHLSQFNMLNKLLIIWLTA